MNLIGAEHPWWRPLWRRVLVTGICAGWAAVELATGGVFWAILAGGLAALCAWPLLVAYPPEDRA